METIARFFDHPDSSFFLFGPRGTGKSTMLSVRFQDAFRIDLLDPETYRTIAARPETLREIVEGNANKNMFVLDEVQKTPSVLNVVHALIEEQQHLRSTLP